jgi:hypothetical protein
MASFLENQPNAQPLSVSELQKRVHQVMEQKVTGLARISFLTGEEMLLFIQRGNVRQVYFSDKTPFQRIPEAWYDRLQPGRLARFSIQTKPARRLLFEKAMLETPVTSVEKKPAFQTIGLPALFTSLENQESASLAHIRWRNAEAFVLIPGSKLSLRRAFFFREATAEENDSALIFIQIHPEPECEITLYRGGLGSVAWLEIHLNILFEWLCNYTLAQYGYLTGRVMVTPVAQNLLILASQKGWDINRLAGEVVDQTLFASPAEAANAYLELLDLLSSHVVGVIGSSLLQSIQRQAVFSLNSFYLSLLKSYGFIHSEKKP